ncbi:MAG: hypothetical protein KGY99_06575 [Phycisphaerae bacterium]|nr:hypothetical protein [Phycisphaerae bacterium]
MGRVRDVTGDIMQAAEVESRLRAGLSATAASVARAECFDAEQRAEVYAILDSLRADTEAHGACVGRWVNDQTGEGSDV